MFTFRSPSAEWKVEQFLIAKPPPNYYPLKYSRFSANIFSAIPPIANNFVPIGIGLKTNIEAVVIPTGESIDTRIRRISQRVFLLLVLFQATLLVSKSPSGPEKTTMLSRMATINASDSISLA